MSYTQFSYSHFVVTPSTDGRQPITIRFDVSHNGPLAGTDTPQVYLTLAAATGEPGRHLAGFGQVTLRPGQAQWGR